MHLTAGPRKKHLKQPMSSASLSCMCSNFLLEPLHTPFTLLQNKLLRLLVANGTHIVFCFANEPKKSRSVK